MSNDTVKVDTPASRVIAYARGLTGDKTAKAFADRSGINDTQISRWANGQTRRISGNNLQVIADTIAAATGTRSDITKLYAIHGEIPADEVGPDLTPAPAHLPSYEEQYRADPNLTPKWREFLLNAHELARHDRT